MPSTAKLLDMIARAHSGAQALNSVQAFSTKQRLDLKTYLAVINAFVDRDFRGEAIDLLFKANELFGPTLEIFMQSGEIAFRLKLYDIAAKFFTLACQTAPNMAINYYYLAECFRHLQNYSDAKTILEAAIQQFTDNSLLHLSMSKLAFEGYRDHDAAFEHAHKAQQLDDANTQCHLQLGNLYYCGEYAQTWYREGLRLDPDNPEIRKALGMALLFDGRMDEAWPFYESRLDCADYDFRYDAPIGKRKNYEASDKGPILLLGEQGIGDELIFGFLVADFVKECSDVYIACEPRLVPIYERNLPSAKVFAYHDTFDHGRRTRTIPVLTDQIKARKLKPPRQHIYVGSLMQRYWRTMDDLQKRKMHLMQPCRKKVEHFKKYIRDPERKAVGISWTSENLKGVRAKEYYGYDLFLELADRTDADFYILQYNCPEDVKAKLCEHPNIFAFDDVDLRNDIEANLAIISLLDITVGPFIATQSFAASAGTPVIALHGYKAFFMFGSEFLPSIYPSGSRWLLDYHAQGRSIEAVIADIADCLDQTV